MVLQKGFEVITRGRGSCLITKDIQDYVATSGTITGVAQLFVHHTSASLMLCENADPQVRADLERFIAQLAPDGDPLFHPSDEGPDDMPAHVRTLLSGPDFGMPISAGRCVVVQAAVDVFLSALAPIGTSTSSVSSGIFGASPR